jgi:hypothetical protein
MSKRITVQLFGVLALCCSAAFAQSNPGKAGTKVPAKVPAGFFDQFRHQRSLKFNHFSAETKGLVQSGAQDSDSRLPTFRTWRGSFNYLGTNFPFIMAGRNPRLGDETRLDTAIIFLNFTFDEFVDSQGNNIVITSDSIVPDVLGSPNLVASAYTDGVGQFSDAVQRASFFNIAEQDWHTTLEQPRTLTPVTIEVPIGLSQVFESNGKFIAFISFDFLFSQIQTILQLEEERTDELVLLVSRNVSADVALGFHDAFDVQVGGRKGIQTYLWTSWFDPDTVDPIFADATTITHEVSEWVADPFVNNIVPTYVIPDSGTPPFCSNFLEVGDPIEFLPNQMFPVIVNGHVFHTQVETLLPWFSREVPSSAFQHAYSYPDTSVLLSPSSPCPTP